MDVCRTEVLPGPPEQEGQAVCSYGASWCQEPAGCSGDVEQVVPSPGEAPRTPAGASVGRGCMKGLQRSQGSCVIQASYSQEQDDAAKPFLGNVTVP